VSGDILNSKGIPVAVVHGHEIFDLKGKKLYDIKGVNIYRLSRELVGHLSDARGSEKRLDRSTERLFPAKGLDSAAWSNSGAEAKPNESCRFY
jgi:hypothetical protein